MIRQHLAHTAHFNQVVNIRWN